MTKACSNFLGDEGTSPHNTESNSCNTHCKDVNIRPKEFFCNRLIVKESTSCVGKSWIFYLNAMEGMIGYEFDSQQRLYGYRHQNSINEEFFIECRNFTKTWSGIIGALITNQIEDNTYEAHIIFTQGIIYDTKDYEYKLCYHRIQKGIKYKSIIENSDNDEFIKSSFYLHECQSVKTCKIVYVNVLPNYMKLENSEPIDSNSLTPDHLRMKYDVNMNYIKLQTEKKRNFSLLRMNRYDKRKFLPNVLIQSKEKTVVYVCCSKENSNKEKLISGNGWYMIPYKFGPRTVTLAPIRIDQLKLLKKMCLERNGLSSHVYQRIVLEKVNETKQFLILCLSLDIKNHPAGFCVVKSTETFQKTSKMIQSHVGIPHIYMMAYDSNPHDFALSKGMISIFRGYN